MNDRAPTSVLEQAAAFAAELAPRAAEFDRAECLPREVVQRMADLGLLGATVPVE